MSSNDSKSIINEIVRTSNKLFAAEEWDIIFTAYQNININPYDYDTVSNALLSYIKANNPEEYHQYTTNGVMRSHLELFSRLAHALSYRYEQSTRENFFDTAEYRESIIELARSFSYQPKRNRAAVGQCKVTAIRTTEPIVDKDGNNISSTTIKWGDLGDTTWYSKFVRVINAALSSTNPVGKPLERRTYYNIRHDLYPIDRLKTATVVPSFKAKVNSTSYSFEAVSTSFGDIVDESTPDPFSTFNILYKNDGGGNYSSNTGFFVQFKQGELDYQDFVLDTPIPHHTITLDIDNINETDVWVCEVRDDGTIKKLWQEVDSLEGQNVMYEKVYNANSSVYSTMTLPNNQVTIKFGDDDSGAIPYGKFRVWYRVSENTRYIIKRNEIQSKPINIPYVGKDGQVYQLTLYLTNQEAVDNAEPEESKESIRVNAPLSHYTQDRMINGEDYNIYPRLHTSLIKKVKTVNRTHSGHSRYMDIYDTTNNISKITMVAEDGYIYVDTSDEQKTIDVSMDIDDLLIDIMENVVDTMENSSFKNYLYSAISNEVSMTNTISWRTLPTQNTFYNRGYFTVGGKVSLVGEASDIPELKILNDKSLIILHDDTTTYLDYYENDGYVNPNITPIGAVELRDHIQDGAIISAIIPHIITEDFTPEMFDAFAGKAKNRESFNVYYRVFNNEFVDNSDYDDAVFIQSYTYVPRSGDDSGKYDIVSPSFKYIIGSNGDIKFFHKPSPSLLHDPISGEFVQDYISIGAGNISLGEDDSNKSTFLMTRDKSKDITTFKNNGDF